ncbi:hypothetical protein [Shewanella algae]|uniref:hypothetical protein n=1 Tax=Shewanella algae TaxID=38313 RepID=UPI0031F4F3F8
MKHAGQYYGQADHQVVLIVGAEQKQQQYQRQPDNAEAAGKNKDASVAQTLLFGGGNTP